MLRQVYGSLSLSLCSVWLQRSRPTYANELGSAKAQTFEYKEIVDANHSLFMFLLTWVLTCELPMYHPRGVGDHGRLPKRHDTSHSLMS